MADLIQTRRDTSANWTAANPILAQGEMGTETDTLYLKIGDGTTVWTSLPYINTSVVDPGTLDGQTLRWEASTVTWEATSDLVVTDGGNVGIGTTAPNSRLAVTAAGAGNGIELDPDDVDGPKIYSFNRTGGTYESLTFQTQEMMFRTGGGNERMRIDSAGNVGIGTAAPQGIRLNLLNAAAGTLLRLSDGITQTLNISVEGVATTGGITYDNPNDGYQRWTRGALERMRIDTAGSVLVGKTVSGTLTTGIQLQQDGRAIVMRNAITPLLVGFNGSSGTNISTVAFYQDGVASGGIQTTSGGMPSFFSGSDAALKENIVDLGPQLANIMALRPRTFDMREGASNLDGFIAQEVEQVWPDLVGEGTEDMEGFKMLGGLSNVDARLVKAIQEQQSMITDLTARLEALENK